MESFCHWSFQCGPLRFPLSLIVRGSLFEIDTFINQFSLFLSTLWLCGGLSFPSVAIVDMHISTFFSNNKVYREKNRKLMHTDGVLPLFTSKSNSWSLLYIRADNVSLTDRISQINFLQCIRFTELYVKPFFIIF